MERIERRRRRGDELTCGLLLFADFPRIALERMVAVSSAGAVHRLKAIASKRGVPAITAGEMITACKQCGLSSGVAASKGHNRLLTSWLRNQSF